MVVVPPAPVVRAVELLVATVVVVVVLVAVAVALKWQGVLVASAPTL